MQTIPVFLPCVALESPIWCYHVDTGRFEGEFSWKYEFAVVVSPYGEELHSI